MEERKKVICIKKCLSSTYAIANVGDIFYVNVPAKKILSEIELLYDMVFNKLYTPEIEIYPKLNLSILCEYNISRNQGEFDARNFMTPAEFRDSRIDEIFTDCKLLN